VDEACALKRRRGLIRRQGQQQLVDLRGEVGAFGRRRNHPAFGIHADRDDDRAQSLPRVAGFADDLLPREGDACIEVALEPLRKRPPGGSAHGVDRAGAARSPQADEDEVELQQLEQRVRQPGSHDRRFSAYPRRGNARERDEVPEHRSEAQDLGFGLDGHSARDGGAFRLSLA
jgi:hypothetical protein